MPPWLIWIMLAAGLADRDSVERQNRIDRGRRNENVGEIDDFLANSGSLADNAQPFIDQTLSSMGVDPSLSASAFDQLSGQISSPLFEGSTGHDALLDEISRLGGGRVGMFEGVDELGLPDPQRLGDAFQTAERERISGREQSALSSLGDFGGGLRLGGDPFSSGTRTQDLREISNARHGDFLNAAEERERLVTNTSLANANAKSGIRGQNIGINQGIDSAISALTGQISQQSGEGQRAQTSLETGLTGMLGNVTQGGQTLAMQEFASQLQAILGRAGIDLGGVNQMVPFTNILMGPLAAMSDFPAPDQFQNLTFQTGGQ